MPDLLHASLGGLGLVSRVVYNLIGIYSCPEGMQYQTMVGQGPEKPYLNLEGDFEVTWAQRRSNTYPSFR